MTKEDAKMIAREVYKLLKGDLVTNEWLSASEAAAYLGISTRSLYNKAKTLPSTKVPGQRRKYSRKGLERYLNGNEH